MKKISKEKLSELILINITGADFGTLDEDKDITELGVNSIGFIQIIVAIENEIGKEVPDSYLLLSEMNTLRKIYNVIDMISK